MKTLTSRTLVNLALLGLIGLLAAVVLLEPGIEPPAPKTRLSEQDPDGIARIRIERPDAPTIVLEKSAGGWQITEPLRLPASEFRVIGLTEMLRSESQGTVPVTDPARFGLAPPRATLSLEDTRIEFGDTEPISGRRYVRLGQTVHLVADTVLHQLTDSATSFVHPGPLGPGAEPVGFRLSGGKELRLTEGKWVLTPDDQTLGADALNGLAQAWRDAQSASVRSYTAPERAEALEVSVRGREEPLRFQVAKGEYEVVLGRPEAGVEYHIPSAAAERLLDPSVHAPAPPVEPAPAQEPPPAVGEAKPTP
jgi:hypothetical protein